MIATTRVIALLLFLSSLTVVVSGKSDATVHGAANIRENDERAKNHALVLRPDTQSDYRCAVNAPAAASVRNLIPILERPPRGARSPESAHRFGELAPTAISQILIATFTSCVPVAR
jgi:hypothetical protein